ncbi:MAG: GNAT family protein [Chloroflexi bacterium]|nr:GNAT family protein [Chloroflexota bacterium]
MQPPPQPADPHFINIVGDKVALGPLRRDLLPFHFGEHNSFEANVTFGLMFPVSDQAVEAWYDALSHGPNRLMIFTIYERIALQPVGVSLLQHFDWRARKAEFAIIIGDSGNWGKGYGTETTRLMLRFGFEEMGLMSVFLNAYSFNERGLGAYRRAGFRETHRRRGAHRIGGRAYDVVHMECLASEFAAASPDAGSLA